MMLIMEEFNLFSDWSLLYCVTRCYISLPNLVDKVWLTH